MPDFGLRTDDLFAVTETFMNVSQILGASIFGSRAKEAVASMLEE